MTTNESVLFQLKKDIEAIVARGNVQAPPDDGRHDYLFLG
jgi:hypothetical protein